MGFPERNNCREEKSIVKDKAKTIIERFGFKDGDLVTPLHDKMMMWLLDKQNCLGMLKSLDILKITNTISLERPTSHCDWSFNTASCTGVCTSTRFLKHEELKNAAKKHKQITVNNYQALLKRTPKLSSFIGVELEHPILGYNNFNIGFIDVAIHLNNYFSAGQNDDACTFFFTPFVFSNSRSGREDVFVEIKTTIPSLGELIRQINFYRSHGNREKWIVVSKDVRFKQQLQSQNIYFFNPPLGDQNFGI